MIYGFQLGESLQMGGDVTTLVGLLSTGVGAFLPRVATANEPVSLASAKMTYYGVTRASVQSAAIHTAISGLDFSDGAYASTSILLAHFQSVWGFSQAKNRKWTEHQAEAYAFYGDISLIGGVLAGTLAFDDSPRWIGLTTLGVHALGLRMGFEAAQHTQKSMADYRLMKLTTGLGVYSGLTSSLLFSDQPRLTMAMGLGTGALGFYAGDKLAEKWDLSNAQVENLFIATLVGAATGVGVAYMKEGDVATRVQNSYLGFSTIGALGGFALTYNAMKDDFKAKKIETAMSRVQLDVNPIGLAGVVAGKSHEKALPGSIFNLKIGLN